MKDKFMNKMKIGFTHGDINGISYEVLIKTLSDQRITDICIPVIYGSPKVLAYYRKAFNTNNPNPILVSSVKEVNSQRIYIVNCITDNVKVEIGKSTPEAGSYALQALQKAVQDLKYGDLDAIVTCPINKKNIQSENFDFPGHTEYLAREFNSSEYLMLLICETLKVGVVTGHLPLSEVPAAITEEAILLKLRVLNKSLMIDFGIRKPKIAVLSLNPHCGDEGVLGNEEKDVIIPTIEKARKEGILAIGPFPADGFFGATEYKHFDAVLAMYHDQGLSPFKLLAFEDGVNYTAGLPIVRTSPAHGTAYEIAGKGIASEVSLRNALYNALDILKNRFNQADLVKNQLDDNEALREIHDTDIDGE